MRSRKGAVSVETAIVIVPFMLLTLMTLEVTLIVFFQSIFNKAVYDTGRLIRTGNEASNDATAGYTTTQEENHLITDICNDAGQLSIVALPYCTTRTTVVVDAVTSVPTSSTNLPSGISGGALVQPPQFYKDGVLTSTFPAACNLVVLKALYQWPILVFGNQIFLKNSLLTNMPSFLFSSVAVFQNEPPTTGGQCSGLFS